LVFGARGAAGCGERGFGSSVGLRSWRGHRGLPVLRLFCGYAVAVGVGILVVVGRAGIRAARCCGVGSGGLFCGSFARGRSAASGAFVGIANGVVVLVEATRAADVDIGLDAFYLADAAQQEQSGENEQNNFFHGIPSTYRILAAYKTLLRGTGCERAGF